MRHNHEHLHGIATLFWATCGVLAGVAIVLGALLNLEPAEAEGVTAVAIAAAVLWLVHEWRILWREERRG